MNDDRPQIVQALDIIQRWLHSLNLPPCVLIYAPPQGLTTLPAFPGSGYLVIDPSLPHWYLIHHVHRTKLTDIAHILGGTL